MHGTYAQNKKSIYNYREKNIEKIRIITNRYLTWKKIQKIYLAILLN